MRRVSTIFPNATVGQGYGKLENEESYTHFVTKYRLNGNLYNCLLGAS